MSRLSNFTQDEEYQTDTTYKLLVGKERYYLHVQSYIYSRRFQKNQQIVDVMFYYPEFHTSVGLALIRQNKR